MKHKIGTKVRMKQFDNAQWSGKVGKIVGYFMDPEAGYRISFDGGTPYICWESEIEGAA